MCFEQGLIEKLFEYHHQQSRDSINTARLLGMVKLLNGTQNVWALDLI